MEHSRLHLLHADADNRIDSLRRSCGRHHVVDQAIQVLAHIRAMYPSSVRPYPCRSLPLSFSSLK